MYEGVPTYPDINLLIWKFLPSGGKVDRFWDIVERHKVTQYFSIIHPKMGIYTAPTAIRALMRYGDDPVNKHDLSSIRILGTVGEPINIGNLPIFEKNPKAWTWYHRVVGKGKAPIVDTYWQKNYPISVIWLTETGGFIMTPIATATPTKPGSCCLPFLGIKPIIFDLEGDKITEVDEGGYFAMAQMSFQFEDLVYPWPGMLRDVWGDTERFKETYLNRYPGYYTNNQIDIGMSIPEMAQE